MKLLFLSASGEMGGAERSLYDIMASIRAAEPGWGLHLIVPHAGVFSTRASALGVEVEVVEFPPALARLGDAGAGGPAGRQISRVRLVVNLLAAVPGLFRHLRKLRAALRRISPDVVHANGLKAHVLSVWARPGARPPVVWHVHDYVGQRPLMARLLRKYSRRCAAAIVNSDSVGADLRAVCGDGLKTFTLYNAVDLEVFSPEGERLDLDALSGLPAAAPGTVRVGLLATMARWKGHETFLTALSLLPADTPVRGYVIGGSIYRTQGSQFSPEELRGLAARLGLGGRVGFAGFVENPEAAIRSLDVLVHASTRPEPFGLVIAEGMACGLPVIASSAGGAAEIISMGNVPFAHAPGDAGELASQIGRLAADAELRARRGRAGRATAERYFDRARLAAGLAAPYREAEASH